MSSFGNKRNHGEKAKQPATAKRVAPSQTLIFSEQQLNDLAAEIFNQVMRNCGHKQRWKAPDLKPSKETKLLALDPFGRWTRAPPKAKENIQLVPEPLSNKFGTTETPPSRVPSQTVEKKPEREETKADAKELLVEATTMNQELDLRTNPVKGGEDGVILISPDFKDMEDPILQTANEPELDILPIDQAYQPNQEELSHDSTCSRNYTHQGITEKKNQLKSFPHEEDMQLTSRRTCKGPEREQRLFNEVLRSNQHEPSCESTCFRNLTHHRCTANWNHLKIPYGLKVIQLLNQEMLGLPYLEAHGFGQLQNQLWRPGEPYNQQSEALESLDKVRTRIWLERKMQWAFGKAHESDGSEEESKAREAKPPDGLDKGSHAYEVKWIYTSPTAQEEDATRAHTFKTAQENEVTGLWQGPVKSPPELKPIKRPFYIWCWTCTRKRGLDQGPREGPTRGLSSWFSKFYVLLVCNLN